jgi:hypothetical protein
MGTLALVVNNEVKAVGCVPSGMKLKAWIDQAVNLIKS